jgi:ABC-type Zn uptake system ZnuABC Zn-binding protein ZnuA
MKKLVFTSIAVLVILCMTGCTKSLETSNNPPVTATNGNTGTNNGNNGSTTNNDNNPPVTAKH